MLQNNPAPFITTAIQDLAREIEERRTAELESSRRGGIQHNPWASQIHDCARNIVYQVLDGDKRKPFDPWLLARFEEGNRQEKTVIDMLRRLGFEVIDRDVNGQLTIAVPENHTPEFRRGEMLTGRIDCLIKWGRFWIPIEVKSLNPNVYAGIKNLEDFRSKPIYRRYLRQMQMYLYGRNMEFGLFFLTDCLGHYMILPVYLDYIEADWILKHIEGVARAIKKREYPDRIPYDQKLCGTCDFAALCLPDVMNKAADMIDNPDLEAKLARHEELHPFKLEFEELHDQIKSTFEKIEKAVVGARWMVQNLPSQRTVYDIPPDVLAKIEELKKPYMKKVPTTRLSIQDLNSKAA